jgi:hypothetical protein
LDWSGLDWIGLDWMELDWIGWDWIGLDWIGLDWMGLDGIGLVESPCCPYLNGFYYSRELIIVCASTVTSDHLSAITLSLTIAFLRNFLRILP